MEFNPNILLADRGDLAPGQGEQLIFDIAAIYLDGIQHDLFLSAGQVVLERLTPTGRIHVIKPEPRLSAEVMAAAGHDLIGDRSFILDRNLIMTKSISGYRFRVTVMPVGLYGTGLEFSLRVLLAPEC